MAGGARVERYGRGALARLCDFTSILGHDAPSHSTCSHYRPVVMESEPAPSALPEQAGYSSGSPLLRNSLCLLLLRAIYFFVARRFLQHSLSPALRDLSKPLLPLHTAVALDRREDSEDDSSMPGSAPNSPLMASLLLPETSSTGASTPAESTPALELSDLGQRVSERVEAAASTLKLRHKTGTSSKKGTRQLSRVSR